MYLKRLELQGFKSFVDRTGLDLGPGITAIVGPNGSGKSNLAEAIRWVLGETSARVLRGTRMEDVIFTGSEARRPVGLAEVCLTLDNADGTLPLEFSEVQVARRVDRSGEGEYLINGTACRLRDVQELFYDTGLGHGALSLIGQGQVEEVLTARPEERRALLEEAAGIVRYRQRKREALRRMEETRQSLERIQDLLLELEGQLGPLAAEAEAARRYLALEARLREVELAVDLAEVKRQLRAREATAEKVAALAARLAELEEEARARREAGEVARRAAREREKQRGERQEALYRIEAGIERLQGKLELGREREQALAAEEERARAAAAEAAARLAELADRERELDLSLQDLAERAAGKERDLAAVEEEIAAARAARGARQEQKEALRRQSITAAAEEAEAANRLAEAEKDAALIAQRRERAGAERRQLAAELAEARERSAAAEAALRRAEEAVREARSREESLRERLRTREREHERRRRQLDEVRAAWQEASARLRVLQEVQSQHEGYYRGVQALLQARAAGLPAVADVLGVVAEVVRVPERYEAAVEVALGASLQDVVTATEAGAKRAIAYLREKRAGRATFLPLNTIRPRELPLAGRQVLGRPGIVGVAADLVEWPPRLEPVGRHLLGATLVAVDLDAALAAARESGFSVRLVTLAGEVVHPGGSLTGGSREQRGRGSLLNRSRALEELRLAVREAEARLAEARVQAEGLEADLVFLAQAVREAEGERRERESALLAARREEEREREQAARLEQRLAWLEAEEREQEEQLAAAAAALEELRAALEARRAGRAQVEEALAALDRCGEEEDETDRQAVAASTALQVELAALRQEENLLRRELERIVREREDLGGQKEAWQAAAAAAREARASLAGETAGWREELARLAGEKEELTRLAAEEPPEDAGLLAELEAALAAAESARAEALEHYHAGQLRLARLEAEAEGAQQRLREKYGLGVNEAQAQAREVNASAAEVRRLQEELAALGPVNAGAVQQYERLKERHDFLASQRDDLLAGEKSLLDVLREIDAVMRERFLAAYQEVSAAFSETFRGLFGGGTARLVLTNPEDALETGVDIVAQPPGKKLASLSLLSGGERALTAIALLFALLRVRPSAFCVLDEIDAALDEANVGRFASFLRERAQETQFIVITHRQRTMEAADVLYGVTMETAGVSQLVSVRLAGVTSRAG